MKTKASLYGKLYRRGRIRGADDISDIIRYTVVVPEDDYAELLPQLFSTLDAAGYPCLRLKNTWDPARPAGYHAIHYDFGAKEGIRGEVQFHIQESLAAKRASHDDYKRGVVAERIAPAYPAFRRVPFPKGVAQIGA